MQLESHILGLLLRVVRQFVLQKSASHGAWAKTSPVMSRAVEQVCSVHLILNGLSAWMSRFFELCMPVRCMRHRSIAEI